MADYTNIRARWQLSPIGAARVVAAARVLHELRIVLANWGNFVDACNALPPPRPTHLVNIRIGEIRIVARGEHGPGQNGHVDRDHPLLAADLAGLHDRALADREVLAAVFAPVGHRLATRNDRVPHRAAVGAEPLTVRPAGRRHSCGLLADGTIKCWGNYSYGQAPGVSAERYTAVTAGDSHTCALKSDGSIRCWGRNANEDHGQATRRAGSSPP